MSDFLFRLPFAFLGSYIGNMCGGITSMICGSFMGCCVGDLVLMLVTRWRMAHDQTRRCCGTCKYRTPINASIPYQCVGCIKGGELTKWEPAGGKYDG